MNANASILAAFATIGMMYAARLAGMDWQFTLLVGCCIGFACLQSAKHKAKKEDRERQIRDAAEAEKRRGRR